MKHAKLNDMVKGWFVGPFQPTLLDTKDCEVAVKHYKQGDNESAHYHRVATEITVIISGEVKMLDQTWKAGDIISLSPGETTAFEALTDAITVVVKHPGEPDDKYVV